jgi:hypothetical protein
MEFNVILFGKFLIILEIVEETKTNDSKYTCNYYIASKIMNITDIRIFIIKTSKTFVEK